MHSQNLFWRRTIDFSLFCLREAIQLLSSKRVEIFIASIRQLSCFEFKFWCSTDRWKFSLSASSLWDFCASAINHQPVISLFHSLVSHCFRLNPYRDLHYFRIYVPPHVHLWMRMWIKTHFYLSFIHASSATNAHGKPWRQLIFSWEIDSWKKPRLRGSLVFSFVLYVEAIATVV